MGMVATPVAITPPTPNLRLYGCSRQPQPTAIQRAPKNDVGRHHFVWRQRYKTLYQAIVSGKATVAAQRGSSSRADVANEYRERIQSDIQLARPMNIVIDAGNGVAGAYAGDIYRALGCSVIELFCEVDGTPFQITIQTQPNLPICKT